MTAVITFEEQRPRLFGLAYRMLGSAQDAEDAVQDAWLRWAGAVHAQIESPAAWLTTALTRLCLTRLTSARARRETYVGPWLPEPILTTDPAVGPAESAAQRESVSVALLVTLERLTPVERAVYVLREAFGYSHAEVAAILEVTEANSRQLHTRARRHVAAEPPAPVETDAAAWGALVQRFLGAAREGDIQELETLLAADAAAWSDGGGKVSAARRPVHGRSEVARFLAGILGRFASDVTGTVAEVNGSPAVLGRRAGVVMSVVVVERTGEQVTGLRFVMNPEKLEFLDRQLSRFGEPSGHTS
ncbi:RNA polymerase sigma-70 factor [Pseudonocardia pini]|uniref:RNA polymerase sigma-70 factor n=1 Tax=Pseudonocardia pini TaxID=2758030 RepID=UPI0015F0DF7A|nr:RNA polymerase sigma-70 factor [Pseudonocardia pini]